MDAPLRQTISSSICQMNQSGRNRHSHFNCSMGILHHIDIIIVNTYKEI